jgi:hypothetical protein
MERDEGDRAKLKALIEGTEFMSRDVNGAEIDTEESPART